MRYVCRTVTREGQFNGATIIEFLYALQDIYDAEALGGVTGRFCYA